MKKKKCEIEKSTLDFSFEHENLNHKRSLIIDNKGILLEEVISIQV